MFENPWYAVGAGAILVIAFASGWFQTGNSKLLWGVVAGLAVALGGWGVERWVQTDRESVRDSVFQMAADVQANREDAVLAHVYYSNTAVQNRVRAVLDRVRFSRVDVKPSLDVAVDLRMQPSSAAATFNVVVESNAHPRPIPLFVALRLVLVEGQWKVNAIDVQPFNKQNVGGRIIAITARDLALVPERSNTT